jgi:phosphoglucomutase
MCLAEVAAWCKSKGITVWDQMVNIYEKYGYYKEGIHTVTLKGIDGAAQIKNIMEKIRKNPPKAFGDLSVNEFRDYRKGPEVTGLPVSDVLYFDLSNNSWCCVRPSGTEPKIKFYFYTKQDSREKASAVNEAIKKDIMSFIESVK